MTYKTSLDNLAKGITIGVTILFAIIIIGQYSIIKDAGQAIPIYTTVTLLLIYFIAFAFRPINYSLTADKLIIHRLFADVKIDRNQIKSVELLDKNEIGWAFRTFGVGGLFGYYGKFANTKLGNMTWYATRKDRTVLVQTSDNKKIILTPNDPDKFVADFNL
jgi:Bacterial PH domain